MTYVPNKWLTYVLTATTVSKPNFYYIVYDIYTIKKYNPISKQNPISK